MNRGTPGATAAGPAAGPRPARGRRAGGGGRARARRAARGRGALVLRLRAALRSPRAWAAAGAAVSLGLAIASFNPYLFTGGDNAQYYALAKALAEGRGYVDLVAPGAPPHGIFPPGFPLLLVPFYLVSGGSLVFMKTASLLAAGALLAAVWRLARRDPAVPDWVAAAAVWGVGLYPIFQLYSHWELSDMPFAALAAWTLVAMPGTAAESAPDRIDRRWLLVCALALAAFSVRTAGVTVLATVVGWALLRRHWRRAALAAMASGAAAATWLLWSRYAASAAAASQAAVTRPYVEQFGRIARVSATRADSAAAAGGTINGLPLEAPGETLIGALQWWFGRILLEYGTLQFGALFWPDPEPTLRVSAIVAALGGAALVWGLVRTIRARGLAPSDLYLAASIGLLFAWPWLRDRFFLSIVAVLWIAIPVGLDAASRRLAGSRRPAVAAFALVALVLAIRAGTAAAHQVPLTRRWLSGDELGGYPPYWADSFDAAQWVGANAPPEAVVLARQPTLAWYWSGRPATIWRTSRYPDRKWEAMRQAGVTHVLWDEIAAGSLTEAFDAHRDLVATVYTAPRGVVSVLEIAPDP